MEELKQTPLFSVYERYGAKTTHFGGWTLPIQFSSIKEEHEAVRTRAGLFDVSHMGEIAVTGQGALLFLQRMVTNDVSRLQTGKAQYTVMCQEDGGTLDDFIIYKRGEEDYFLVVNAANTDRDVEWLTQHAADDVMITNVSRSYVQLALQGPKAEAILQKVMTERLSSLKPFTFLDHVSVAKIPTLVARTGYTGEDGFELYSAAEHGVQLWEALMEAGHDEGLMPCGLGARDTLRFEATLPLYGQELSEEISPIEAGLGFVVKVDKAIPFIGQKVLTEQKAQGPKRRLVGLEMIDRGIPRSGYELLKEGEKIGAITTGTFSPTLQKKIGLGLVDGKVAHIGCELEVVIRKKVRKAKVVPTPFYHR